jgi:hypothetical protein
MWMGLNLLGTSKVISEQLRVKLMKYSTSHAGIQAIKHIGNGELDEAAEIAFDPEFI